MSSNHTVDQFIRLFTEHEPRVHAYVLSLITDWAAAEEILQETNAVLWAKFGEFEPGSNFFAWACAIARHKVQEYQRQKQRGGLPLDPTVMEAIESDTVDMADELAARQRALTGCLSKLPPRDRDLIERRYMRGSSTQAVASQVGRSVEAVYKAVQRIRHALHQCITLALGAESES